MVITRPRERKAKGASGCDFLLICWWWSNRAVLQASDIQLEVTISTWLGATVLKDTVLRVCWVGTRMLPRGSAASWMLFPVSVSPPFPYQLLFASEFQRTQERSRRPNEAYILQGYKEIEDPEGICAAKAHRVLLSFNSGNWATTALATSCQNVAWCCLNLKIRLWTVSFSELQVLDLSLI